MRFKEFTRWTPDKMPSTTEAVVVVSECGTVVKRLPYTKWNKINNSYSSMKEHIYKQSSNRGKQRYDSAEKIEKHGKYMHVEINGKTTSIHQMVAKVFIKNPLRLTHVNHINGVRNDNRVDNLEWVSNKENVDHAWKTGLRTKGGMQKLKESDIPRIIELRGLGMSFKKIGEIYNFSGETIRLRVNAHENSIRN